MCPLFLCPENGILFPGGHTLGVSLRSRCCAGSEYDDAGRQYGCWFAPGMSVCLGVVVYNGLVDDRPIGVKVMKAVLQSMCFVELLLGE